jgi:uncharacterized protein (TIGR00251 family)
LAGAYGPGTPKSPSFLEPAPGGVVLRIRVIPRASKTAIAGTRGDALLVRLAAPPVDGAANDALLELLSATLHVARRQLHLVSGAHGRDKRVKVDGIEPQAAAASLAITVS